MPESVRSSISGASNLAEPLNQVKLLSALRSGDPALIHPFLAEIGKDRRTSSGGDRSQLDTGSAALHLAIRCGSASTVGLLLSHRAISPNGIHPPESGTTALHLAASLGRVDIVKLLLEQEGINDTQRDHQGRTCRDVAKGNDVLKVIDDSHSFLNASYRSLLRSYVLSPAHEPPSRSLLDLLESPRVKFVDLSYLDNDSGQSLLHEAARRKDFRLIELAVRAGTDIFVRNRRGKTAYDKSVADERVRVFLRQFANHDTTLIDTPNSNEPPSMRGYLNKYTNVAKGYSTRWFVLQNGVLSYYRHQEDESIASRGSIAMKTAVLKVSNTERLRFEVHSIPFKGHQSVEKWFMKANHHVEAARWVQAVGKSIEWYRRDGITLDGETEATRSRQSYESESSPASPIVSKTMRSHSGSWTTTLLRRAKSDRDSVSSYKGPSDSATTTIQGVGGVGDGSPGHHGYEVDGGETSDGRADASSADTGSTFPPHEAEFELQGNSAAAQLELTMKLLDNFLSLSSPVSSAREKETKTVVKESLSAVQTTLNEFMDMARQRDAWYAKQLEAERRKQMFWEEMLATIVREGETLEKELRVRSRKRGSRFFDGQDSTFKQKVGMTPPMRKTIQEEYFPESRTPATSPPLAGSKPSHVKMQTNDTGSTSTAVSMPVSPPVGKQMAVRSSRFSEESDRLDTDEEDEFFDAIESGTLPNLEVPDELVSPVHDLSLFTAMDLKPYEPYRNLRVHLELSEERPNTSLWSVLKHSIGKDLTKISFPVFFNEPTSMLQRMAEDMEFSECLDAAAQQKDPLRRIAYVAAFAMSNYSSTIGRIAKPFNPMLSETFEYVRLDKEYRYVSEQVSHHPPISACWAESPSWHYYGEVDAQNRFMGKSFEIRPTGVAHADLLLPEERAPKYPRAAGKKGKVVEHYSWKKVTTSVSGFILGSPTIDHYGDMVITNHRTKDQCILTFKPRGWRGKDAYEIAGQVLDARGKVAYDIAGRWNSQLIASPASNNPTRASLDPDLDVETPTSSSSHLLLWRNSEKPAGSPFNLTPFAITMNDCPAALKPFLCPTDCRLRPDQRAFELGKYEWANTLKQEQEEKQRGMRRAREAGSVAPHRPRWFRAETDGDTGERVWAPSMVGERLEYWVERARVWKEGGRGEWKNVDRIFIDEPEGLE